MIKLTITFQHGDEKTVISSDFKKFKCIKPWLDKVEVLNKDDKLKNKPGFIKEN